MKKILSLLLALLLVAAPLRGVTAQAATNSMPREGSIAPLSAGGRVYAVVDEGRSLWLHYLNYDTETFDPSASKNLTSGVEMVAGENKSLAVLKQDGSLWMYKVIDTDGGVLGPLKLMDGVAKVVANGVYAYSVLKQNGELWNIANDTSHVASEPVLADYGMTQLDTGVADIYSSFYLKGNEVRSVYNAVSELEKTLDFSNGARVWCHNSAYFVLTDDGELWSWGSNARGQLGNGGQYTSTGSIFFVGSFQEGVMSLPIINSEPTKILSDVEDLWVGDGYFRAVDTSGTLWQWGDGENIMTYVELVSEKNYTHGDLIYPDGFPNSFGYIPRQVTAEEWTTSVDYYSTIFKQDGSIWIERAYDKEGEYIYLASLTGTTSASGTPAVTEVTASPTGFTDIRLGYYCEEAVIWAVANGITTGTSTTTFSPDDTCTQGQILTFLWRAAGCPSPDESNVIPFEGSTAQFYYPAVQWALQSGLAESVSAEQECRRSDVVTYLWKLAGCPQAEYSGFTDVNAQDSYASAVAWAVANNITTGTSATTFSPNDTCTRGQIVTFLYRYFTAAEEAADVELA